MAKAALRNELSVQTAVNPTVPIAIKERKVKKKELLFHLISDPLSVVNMVVNTAFKYAFVRISQSRFRNSESLYIQVQVQTIRRDPDPAPRSGSRIKIQNQIRIKAKRKEEINKRSSKLI